VQPVIDRTDSLVDAPEAVRYSPYVTRAARSSSRCEFLGVTSIPVAAVEPVSEFVPSIDPGLRGYEG
jgi:hypothetical protein